MQVGPSLPSLSQGCLLSTATARVVLAPRGVESVNPGGAVNSSSNGTFGN